MITTLCADSLETISVIINENKIIADPKTTFDFFRSYILSRSYTRTVFFELFIDQSTRGGLLKNSLPNSDTSADFFLIL